MIDYKNYLDDINLLFKNNEEILSTDLKKYLKLENKGNLWGSLLSTLISKKIIEKNADKFEKVNGHKIYYYNLVKSKNRLINKKDILILDQFGNQYDCLNLENLNVFIKNILFKNPNLELSVYKKTNFYDATVTVKNNGMLI